MTIPVMSKEWQDQETFDEMDKYLDGDWSPESLERMGQAIDATITENKRLAVIGKDVDSDLCRCE